MKQYNICIIVIDGIIAAADADCCLTVFHFAVVLTDLEYL